MDIITINQIKQLAEGDSGPRVSLYMPTHRAGSELEQDPIRLRNLLRQAEAELKDAGMRTPDVRSLLEPAQALLQDSLFWEYLSDGLAIFLTRGEHYLFRLPIPFEEQVIVTDRFYLKPLLPFFMGDGLFYILALSQDEVKLIEASLHTAGEVPLRDMPQSLAEALRFDEFEQNLQFHTSSAPPGAGRPAMFHGHSGEDDPKVRILQWFQRIDEALPEFLADRQTPIVLAGVEFLLPIYKEANSLCCVLDEGIEGSPEELSVKQLHAKAMQVIQPVFARSRHAAQDRYQESVGTGLATAQVEQVVLGAHYGRVDTLFIANDAQVWGTYDPDNSTVEVHPSPEEGDQDLMDAAAVQTLLNGGRVFAVAPEEMPDSAPLAAIFRY
jgi:hypothetical protein